MSHLHFENLCFDVESVCRSMQSMVALGLGGGAWAKVLGVFFLWGARENLSAPSMHNVVTATCFLRISILTGAGTSMDLLNSLGAATGTGIGFKSVDSFIN